MYFRRVQTAAVLAIGSFLLFLGVMISGPWLARIIAFLLMVTTGLFSVMVIRMYGEEARGDWSQLADSSAMNIKLEPIAVPTADEVQLSGLFLSRKHHSHERRPTVIALHGFLSRKEDMYYLALPLAAAGYNVILIDARGHGQTRKDYPAYRPDDWFLTQDTGIFPDLKQIVDYTFSLSNVDTQRVAVVGKSMAAGMALVYAKNDPRIALNIAISPFWAWSDLQKAKSPPKVGSEAWFYRVYLNSQLKREKIISREHIFSPKAHFSPENAPKYRPTTRLVHARNDQILDYETHFLPIQNILKLPQENVLILEGGGHFLRGQETLVVAQVQQWLDTKFYRRQRN